jgi:hypothetical protein
VPALFNATIDLAERPLSQFHQRLYLIDTQVKHLDKTSLEGLGRWLCRKWYHCVEKKDSVTEELDQLGLSLDYL